MPKYWLMKAEPDSRIVKGKDVKVLTAPNYHHCKLIPTQFSVDDFEASRYDFSLVFNLIPSFINCNTQNYGMGRG